MFDRLKRLVAERVPSQSDQSSADEATAPMAAAMLLLEVAWADHEIEADELDQMHQALTDMYALDPSAVDALIERARADHAESTSLYPFTRTLNESLTRDEKRELLEHLWRITSFEGDRRHYAEHEIRKITELLYLHHSDFIAAKLAAKSS